MLDLYLIRHAESEMNLLHEGIIGGRSNATVLSKRGEYQASLLGERFVNNGIAFDEIYSSTAVRTIKTAQIVAEKLGYSLDNIVRSPQLLELDQGDYEGKSRIETYTPEVLQAINLDNWNFTPPHGESQKVVEERMLAWVGDVLLPRYEMDLTVAVFSHGVAIRCLLRGIMDFSAKMTGYKISTENTSITRLKYDSKGWNVVTINDTGHLLGRQL